MLWKGRALLTCPLPGGSATAVEGLIMPGSGAGPWVWEEGAGLELGSYRVHELSWLPPPTCKVTLLSPILQMRKLRPGAGEANTPARP